MINNDDDIVDLFQVNLPELEFCIATTSAHRARRGKIKLLLYNSNPSYRLRLFRISSVQPLLRFDNLECS